MELMETDYRISLVGLLKFIRYSIQGIMWEIWGCSLSPGERQKELEQDKVISAITNNDRLLTETN